MYLADKEILRRLDGMGIEGPEPAHPFNPAEQVQPCSIDLRVSNVFWRPSRRREFRRLVLRRPHAIDLRRAGVHDLDALRDLKRVELKEGEFIGIKPGQVVMGRIYERFRMPPDCAGKIEGRSSYARLGLAVHLTGDFINPGWEGYMPLQMFNAGPYPILLPPFRSRRGPSARPWPPRPGPSTDRSAPPSRWPSTSLPEISG